MILIITYIIGLIITTMTVGWFKGKYDIPEDQDMIYGLFSWLWPLLLLGAIIFVPLIKLDEFFKRKGSKPQTRTKA